MTAELKSFVTFDAAIPDDRAETSGVLEAPAGRNVLEHIVTALQSRGIVCTPPEQHSFYGWKCRCSVPGKRGSVFVLLQSPGPWLLLCEPIASFWFASHAHGALEELLSRLDDILQSDQSIRNVQWYSAGEYNARSSKH